MDEENLWGDKNPYTESGCTGPVITDRDDLQEILHELLRRTTDMERRLDRLLDQTNSVEGLAASERHVLESTSQGEDSTTNADEEHLLDV